jgi:hypothetical protein
MADNVTLDNNTTTGQTIRTVRKDSVQYPVSILDVGTHPDDNTGSSSLVSKETNVGMPVEGLSDSQTVSAGAPVLIGAKHLSAAPTLTSTHVATLLVDSRNNLSTTIVGKNTDNGIAIDGSGAISVAGVATIDYDTDSGSDETDNTTCVGIVVPASGGAAAVESTSIQNTVASVPADPVVGLNTSQIGSFFFDGHTEENDTTNVAAFGIAIASASGPIAVGTDGSTTTYLPVSVGNFPATQTVSGTVAVSGVTGTVTVDGSGVTQPVSGTVAVSGVTGTVTVDGSGVTQPVSGTVAVSGVTGTVTVDGSGVTQPVSGTVAVSGVTGTVTVDGSGVTQPVSGNVAVSGVTGTVTVDGSGVTQPVSGTVAVSGVTGTVNVDGSGVTQPVSGTVAVSGVTGTVTVDGSAVTQPVSGTVAVSGVTGTVTVDGSGVTQPVSGNVGVTSISSGTNLIGDVGIQGRTTGGLTAHSKLDYVNTPEDVKSSAGTVYGITVFNMTASPFYIKFYDETVSVNRATHTPKLRFAVPSNASSSGAGFVFNVPQGIAFGNRIQYAITTGVADTDASGISSGNAVVNIAYK